MLVVLTSARVPAENSFELKLVILLSHLTEMFKFVNVSLLTSTLLGYIAEEPFISVSGCC